MRTLVLGTRGLVCGNKRKKANETLMVIYKEPVGVGRRQLEDRP